MANTAYWLGAGDPHFFGILNSRLFWFAISNLNIQFGIRAGNYRYRLIYQCMEKVPIRPINPDNAADKTARTGQCPPVGPTQMGAGRSSTD